MYTVLVVNETLVSGILVETVYLFSRAYIERSFMQDSNFLKSHLISPKIKVLKIRETHKENNYLRDPKTFRTPITFFR